MGITFNATILRKQADLPRYIIVKAEHLPWATGAFAAEVRLNDAPGFQRTIRPWGKGSDAYFFNLTAPQLKRAGLDTGDHCTVTLAPLLPE